MDTKKMKNKKRKQRHIRKSKGLRMISLERIEELFEQASIRFKENRGLAKRYVTLATKIATKYKVSIPSKFKRQFCKKCGNYLVPSINARVRLNKGKLVTLCLDCKEIGRVGYKAGAKKK